MLNEELPAKHCVAKEEHVNRGILRDALLLFVVLVVGFFMGATFTRMQAGGPDHGASWQTSGNLWPWSEDQTVEDAPCDSSGLAPIPALLQRSWIYDELSPAETAYVAEFVIRHMKINATMAGGDATGNCFSGTEAVTLIPPSKVHARAFVDGLVDEPPARYAKVVVVRGLQDLPDVMEYRVGPISGCNVGKCNEPKIDDRAPITPLTKPGAIPYAKRPYDTSDDTMLPLTFVAIKELMPMLSTEIGKIWDWIPGCAPGECYDPAQGRSIIVPYNDISASSSSRISKYTLNWYPSGDQVQVQWLHELPIFMRINQTGADPANWFLYDFTYCAGLPYPTAKSLLVAWQAGKLPSCFDKTTIDPSTSGNLGDWDVPGLKRGSAPRQGSELKPPVQSCSRRRFSLGAERGGNNGRLVSWLGWTFFATVRPSTGVAVMDVRFKGNRIAHELALSEAVAYYSGSGGDQVMYLDSAYSMTQLGKLPP
jgi:primary-amine oxidase